MIDGLPRAFFEIECHGEVCIELPLEESADNNQVGILVRSLYGTRDAAANFQKGVKRFMNSIGFKVGVYNPGLVTFFPRRRAEDPGEAGHRRHY